MNTTTDLETVRKSPRKFSWGEVVAVHDVGWYTIVEYKCGTVDSINYGRKAFHVYVSGKDTHRSTLTLDEALLLAVAVRNSGSSADHMAIAAGRVLGLTQEA